MQDEADLELVTTEAMIEELLKRADCVFFGSLKQFSGKTEVSIRFKGPFHALAGLIDQGHHRVMRLLEAEMIPREDEGGEESD